MTTRLLLLRGGLIDRIDGDGNDGNSKGDSESERKVLETMVW